MSDERQQNKVKEDQEDYGSRVKDLTRKLAIESDLAKRVYEEIPDNIEIVKKIGEGGLGHIFLGIPKKSLDDELIFDNKKEVIVKLSKIDPDDSEVYFKKLPFNRRDKNNNLLVDICKIDNPGMMKVYQVGETFLVSEHCGYSSLNTCFENYNKYQKGTFMSTFLKYFWDLMFTVYKNTFPSKLSEGNPPFSHNDIHPDNIFLHENRFKLIDFDLICDFDRPTGFYFGTPYSSAPEQSSWGDVSEKNDIYSLGVVLYTLTQYDHPFSTCLSSSQNFEDFDMCDVIHFYKTKKAEEFSIIQ